MLNVFMLNVFMLSVRAPIDRYTNGHRDCLRNGQTNNL
jgi:hypothetical protein